MFPFSFWSCAGSPSRGAPLSCKAVSVSFFGDPSKDPFSVSPFLSRRFLPQTKVLIFFGLFPLEGGVFLLGIPQWSCQSTSRSFSFSFGRMVKFPLLILPLPSQRPVLVRLCQSFWVSFLNYGKLVWEIGHLQVFVC